ncbi:type I-E CRISPR-associated protein Cas6/Cse3/CasE [Streptomyces melanogenes]|uniref:type I-E CRISPR-associated protein Cas6/Cse3/CasE n=1 Tax=Streptomyces melanogenes TaxID=67326 RepID=UPI00167EF6AD|nr:type I-E CRISPR-associated protein Cas6/Cse3/CasE [Streptomyces melanogenes]GGP80118.1 type I-E CRISPR-associated protein Cas6/Cse3/CasE [Streptomyces melanogenes]
MAATAHLTRIKIDPWSPEAGRDLRNAQSLHRRVLALIPDQLGHDTRTAAGVLFRLEREQHAHTLLIQSTAPLDLDQLPIGYAHATDERDLTPLLTWCKEGGAIRYRIDAVATRTISQCDSNGQPQRGRRVHINGEEAVAWWHRQAEDAGLTPNPDTTRLAPQLAITVRKDDPQEPDKTIRFGRKLTRFEGTATIHNPQALTDAITNGIGRSKAYGAGLLSIAPLTRA